MSDSNLIDNTLKEEDDAQDMEENGTSPNISDVIDFTSTDTTNTSILYDMPSTSSAFSLGIIQGSSNDFKDNLINLFNVTAFDENREVSSKFIEYRNNIINTLMNEEKISLYGPEKEENENTGEEEHEPTDEYSMDDDDIPDFNIAGIPVKWIAIDDSERAKNDNRAIRADLTELEDWASRFNSFSRDGWDMGDTVCGEPENLDTDNERNALLSLLAGMNDADSKLKADIAARQKLLEQEFASRNLEELIKSSKYSPKQVEETDASYAEQSLTYDEEQLEIPSPPNDIKSPTEKSPEIFTFSFGDDQEGPKSPNNTTPPRKLNRVVRVLKYDENESAVLNVAQQISSLSVTEDKTESTSPNLTMPQKQFSRVVRVLKYDENQPAVLNTPQTDVATQIYAFSIDEDQEVPKSPNNTMYQGKLGRAARALKFDEDLSTVSNSSHNPSEAPTKPEDQIVPNSSPKPNNIICRRIAQLKNEATGISPASSNRIPRWRSQPRQQLAEIDPEERNLSDNEFESSDQPEFPEFMHESEDED